MPRAIITAIVVCTVLHGDDQPTSQPAVDCRSARECFLRGNHERAIALYDELAKKDAVFAACGRSSVDEQIGDYREGINRLKAVEAKGDASADWHACMAALLSCIGEYGEAIAHNRQALKIEENHFRARRQLGELLELLGKRQEAEAIYQPFEDVMTGTNLPSKADDLVALGFGFYRYSTLIRHADIVQRTRHVLTEVYQEAFDFVDSLYWPARLAAAQLLLEKRQFKEAKEDFEAILKQNPNAPDAYVGLGRIALEDWSFEEAEKAAALALKSNPHHVAAHLLLADVNMRTRKYRAAADAAEEALKTNPNSIEALAVLASATYFLGDDAASQNAQRRIERINPESARWHHVSGVWLSAARQFAPAEGQFKKAIDADPTWSEPVTDLGQLYMETGEETEARRTLEAAFTLDSFNRHTHNVLSLLDSLDKFARLETEHFIIKYDAKEDAVVAPYVGEALESFYQEVCDDFGVNLDKKTIIEIFPDHMGFSVRITGRPFIATIGACTGRVIALTAPRGRPPFGYFNWAGVLRHEFTHTVTLAATENRIPHWMTEGLAVHEEPVPRPWKVKTMLCVALRKGDLFDLESIDWGFMRPRRPNDRQLAYAQSEWMMEYIIGRWGYKSALALLTAFRERQSQEAAFRSVLKIEQAAFIDAFKVWAKEQVGKWGLPTDPIEESASLKKKLKDHPEDAALWGSLAQCLLLEEEIEAAEKAAKKALRFDKDQPTALTVISHILIGKMLGEEKDADRRDLISEVDPYLRRLIKVKPDSAAATKYIGYVEQAWEQWPEATEWLGKYQKRYSEDPDSYRRLAGIFLQDKKIDRAMQQLERLFQLEENEVPVARQLGKLYLDKGDAAVAARWYRRALDIDPYDVEIHGALADAQLQAGNAVAAEREYQVVCKLLPEDGIGYDGLSAVYKAMGNKTKSDEYAARAKALAGQRKLPIEKKGPAGDFEGPPNP